MFNLEYWQFPYMCDTCKDIIYSKWIGHWVHCSCYKNEVDATGGYVDQTKYYGHVGGSVRPLTQEELVENKITIKEKT